MDPHIQDLDQPKCDLRIFINCIPCSLMQIITSRWKFIWEYFWFCFCVSSTHILDAFLHFIQLNFSCIFTVHPRLILRYSFPFYPDLFLATFFHFIWNYFWSHFCISSWHIFCHFSGFHPPNFRINFQISEYSIEYDDLDDMISFQLFPITPKSLVSHLATL